MIHCVKKAFPTLLVLYEIIMCSKAAESIQADIPTAPPEIGSTLSMEVTTITTTSTQEQYQHPAPTPNPVRHDTKIEIGATNITKYHHNFEDENRSKPHFRLPGSRFVGPFFEEGPEVANVTAQVGSTINLDCRIGLLGDKTVTWTQKRNENFNLLAVGRKTHSKDERMNLAYRYPNNYRLRISYVTKRDEGIYECRVAETPPKVRTIFLKITAPEVKIVDESIREVHERYYRQGSSLLLTCLATSIGFSEKEPDTNIIRWKHGVNLLSQGSRLNVTKETDSAMSTLTITPLESSHSGNYTCSVGNLVEATVAVHVLNGELPAAVQTAGVHFKSSNTFLLLVIATSWSLLR